MATKQQMWDTIVAERAALAADLEPLDAAAWQTPSLCEGWTVADCLAHMTATARMTPPGFLVAFVGAGLSFPKMVERGIRSSSGADGFGTLANFVLASERRTAPPGPATSWLGEVIIHGEDIRRPLGIQHDYPLSAVTQVAEFYKGSNALIGAKDRIAGVRLVATDAAFTHGTGPEVRGRVLDIVMAMTGRAAALDGLTGDGVAVLRERAQ